MGAKMKEGGKDGMGVKKNVGGMSCVVDE